MDSTNVFEKEFTRKLCERFRFIKSSFYHEKHEHPFDMFGVECGNGWNNILWELCEKIEKILETNHVSQEKFVVAQIKEKYGTLRFYYNAPKEVYKEVDKLVDEAEKKTEITCEMCGENGRMRKAPWIRTLCDKCEKGRFK